MGAAMRVAMMSKLLQDIQMSSLQQTMGTA